MRRGIMAHCHCHRPAIVQTNFLADILGDIFSDLGEQLRTVKGFLGALFLSVFIGALAFLPKEVVDPAWTSRQASATLEASLKQFCAELYSGRTCPRISRVAKTRIIIAAVFSADAAPSLDSVALVLKEQGWTFGAVVDVRRTTYCRAGYAATYETSEERAFVEFSSGHQVCTKPGPNAIR